MTKPIDNPDFISIMLLTRGRPDAFIQMLASLARTAKRKDLIDLWAYVDDDDPTVEELRSLDLGSLAGFAVNFLARPRPVTHGEAFNELWRGTATNAGIYLAVADDYVMETRHWDESIRQSFAAYPDRLVLGRVQDPHLPNMLLIMAMTGEWINELGYLVPPYFPYWFGDRWMEEITRLAQRLIYLDVQMKQNGGKGRTQRMRNLPFWTDFFCETFQERVETAKRLRGRIYDPESHDGRLAEMMASELELKFWEQDLDWKRRDIQWLEESNADPEEASNPPSLSYMKAELQARAHLSWLEGQGLLASQVRAEAQSMPPKTPLPTPA
ncbi:MAG: hypothetical protein HZA67_10435 [Rhodospirillales bacterium]|nr:hypothetical protein [Rhodospirillales bacterium]